jgi:hypothetical protein
MFIDWSENDTALVAGPESQPIKKLRVSSFELNGTQFQDRLLRDERMIMKSRTAGWSEKHAAVAGSEDQPGKSYEFRVPSFEVKGNSFQDQGTARWAHDMRLR